MPNSVAMFAIPPAFEARVIERFGWTKHHLIATLRVDGSPRLSGTELHRVFGNWWLGSMPKSRKAADLRRDSRLSIHSAPQPADEGMSIGDVKVRALAIDRTDSDDARRFAEWLTDAGTPPPPGPFDLFRLVFLEVAIARVDGNELVIDQWSEAAGLRTTRRN